MKNLCFVFLFVCISPFANCQSTESGFGLTKKQWQFGMESLWLADPYNSLPSVMILKQRAKKSIASQSRYLLGFNYQRSPYIAGFFPNNPAFQLNNRKKIDLLLRVGRQKQIWTPSPQLSVWAGADLSYQYGYSVGINDTGRDSVGTFLNPRQGSYFSETNIHRLGLSGVCSVVYQPHALMSFRLENDLSIYYENADNYMGFRASGKYLNTGLWPMSRLLLMFHF